MPGPWEKYQTQGGIVTKPADPTRAYEVPYKQGQIQGQGLNNQGQAIQNRVREETAAPEIRTATAKATSAEIAPPQDLRKEFAALPEVKEFSNVLPIYASALKAAPGGAGDLNVIYGLAKMLDPGSVVRESELSMAQGTGSLAQQLQGYYKSVAQGGKLPPEVRRTLIAEMNNRSSAMAQRYNQQRIFYKKLAEEAGIDPDLVVGPHPSEPFQQAEADYKGRPIINMDQGVGAVPKGFDLGKMPGSTATIYGGGGPAPRGLSLDITDDSERAPPPTWQDTAKQLGQSTINTVAGIGQGIAGLPDLAAKGVGQALAAPTDLLGFDNLANQLRNPLQFGEQIEKLAPTPQDWTGWGVRQASKLGGGVVGLPAKATQKVVEQAAGKVPQFFNPKSLPTVSPKQTYNDARSLGIEPTVEAVGGPASRTATALLAQSLAGSAPTRAGAQRMVEQGGRALGNIAGRRGAASEAEAMGQGATQGALAYRAGSRDVIGKIYERAAKQAGDGFRVKPDRAVGELDRQLADLGEVPMGTEGARYLSELRDEIVTKFPEGVTIDGLRAMRTQLRDKFYKDNLRGSDLERRVNGVVQMVSDDITMSLRQAGKGNAAKSYAQADAAWAERINVLDNTIMPIIGRKGEKSGEQVASALVAATRGNGNRFQQFIKALPEEEAGNAKASLIEGLGRARPGAQDATGDVFSFNELLTNWSKLSPSAKGALFDGTDREAMEKLVRVSSELKDASRYANRSNSGGVFINGLTLFTGVMDVTSGLAVGAGSYGLAKAMASPGVARVVSHISSAKTPSQVKAAAGQLGNLARKYPGAAPELVAMREGLMRAVNEGMPQAGRVAASPDQRPKQPY